MADLLYETSGHVATITLNRPERLNAINGTLLDDLAAALMRQSMLGAETIHRLAACDAVVGLERAGLVVESGVDHAAVVAGLVCGQVTLGLQHHDRPAGFRHQRHGRRRADNTAADNGYII